MKRGSSEPLFSVRRIIVAMIPDYFSLLAEVFIGLAAIAGLVLTLKGAQDSELTKTRALNLLLYAFIGCVVSIAPYVLLDFGVPAQMIWLGLSCIGTIGMPLAALLALHQWRTVFEETGMSGTFAKSVTTVWSTFGILNGLNALGWPLATGSHVVGLNLLAVLCVAAVLFIRVVTERSTPGAPS